MDRLAALAATTLNPESRDLPEGRIFLDPKFEPTKATATYELPMNATRDDCQPLSEPYLLAVSVAPALVMFENLAFLFAVLLYRAKLKHNNVYTYVTSALLANVITSSWAFYHFLNYYYGIESSQPSYWWAFRKGMTAGFSLILCGNIGLLIYAIEDNTYMVGRLVSGNVTSHRPNNRLNAKFRMHKAICLLTVAWIIPVLYGLLSMTAWNCTWGCTCTLHYPSHKPLCSGTKCSRLYTPMAKSYLLFIVVIWFVECSFLLFVISKAAISFPSLTNRTNRSEGVQTTELGETNGAGKNSTNQKTSHIRRLTPRLARSYKFPFILLGLFIACTAPVMVLFVLDWAVTDFQCSTITVNIVTPLPLLYCVISPILLTKRLPGMRWAMHMALSFSWLKSGCGDISNARRKSLGSAKMRGSSLSVTKNSEGRIFDSKASPPSTPV